MSIPIGSTWRSGPERAQADLALLDAEAYTAADFRPGILRHIVLFRFAPTTLLADVDAVTERFLALQRDGLRDGLPYIVSIEAGAQLSTEPVGDGFDRGFIVTFASEGDRNYYIGRPVVDGPGLFDPAHDAFKAFVGPFLDTAGIVAFDFRPDGATH
ncbi:Dabb family protein [Microbacteriaceae bacterium VKM Ac-2855]|nr:Dabb family protein [Microbacteriaceae bacterium VKM Ac-2855]